MQVEAGESIVLFDTTNKEMLQRTGELLWQSTSERPLFTASSSGLTTALVHTWCAEGFLTQQRVHSAVAPVAPLLMVNGSCHVVTSQQIQWALQHGFTGIVLEPARLLDSAERSAPYQEQMVSHVLNSLQRGRDTMLYTALGAATGQVAGDALGTILGDMLRRILKQSTGQQSTGQRVVLCGGDTSSHAVQQLQLFALTWHTSVQPGAPLCLAHASDAKARPLELMLKGGQVGTEDLFALAAGRAPNTH